MIQVKQFKPTIYEMEGISKASIENHLKLYEGYVKKLNEIEEKLKTVDLTTANQVYSDLRELKLEYSFALGGVKHHEIYFEHLGGKGGEPKGFLAEQIVKGFGSYEKWAADFKASGMAARGWVWAAYDWRFGKWFNYIGDSQNTFPIWEGSVAVALDVYEHAYWADYGTDRKSYIEAFMKNLDWEGIEERVEKWGIPS